jgi:protein TonB
MAIEPAFAKSNVWPPPDAMPLEPDDPRIVFPLPGGSAREAAVIVDQGQDVSIVARERLGPKPRATARRKFWRVAIASSVTLHVAVAAFFLVSGKEDAQVAGAEDAGITFLGNAPDDQVSSGRPMVEAMAEVTLIEAVEAKVVEATEAEMVPAESTETLTAEPAERIEAVEERAVVAQVPEETPAAAQEDTTEPVEEAPAPAAPSEVVPEVLATDTVEPLKDSTVVPPQAAEPVLEDRVAEVVAEAEPASPVLPDTVEAVPTQRPKPGEPKAQPKTAKAEQSAKQKEKPAKPKTTKGAAGSGGMNSVDVARGQADGRADGTAKSKASGKSGEKAAGNAAVSNYPGKVRSKVQRSVRNGRGKGQVVVSFTVSASGGVSGVRVARSSGKADLDRAAMDAVRRAAPFPPIPDGRKSWAFSVPIAFR